MFDLGLWLAGNPTPVRVSATWEKPTRDRGVERSGSAFVVCENGASIFFDVTWHHLGEGERFGMGLRAERGAASINPLTVWKELHGVATDVSPTTSASRENAWLSSHRAEWAHFLAVVAGEAKSTNLARARNAAQSDGRDLQVGGIRTRRGAVTLRWTGGVLLLLALASQATARQVSHHSLRATPPVASQ